MLNEGVSNPREDGFSPEPMPPVQDGGLGGGHGGGLGGGIPRPKAIDNAFQASLASTAISMVATVVTVLLDRQWLERLVRQVLEDANQPAGDAEVANAIGTMQVMLAIGILLFAVLFVLFAVKMRAGRNWARMVLTVFAAIGLINFLSSVASSGAALELMWSLADVAFSVTAVIYLFRPESSAYFAEHKKRQLARRGRNR